MDDFLIGLIIAFGNVIAFYIGIVTGIKTERWNKNDKLE
jgi:hypothetical protein